MNFLDSRPGLHGDDAALWSAGMLCAVSCQSVFPTALSHCAVQHFPQDRHRTGADDTDRSAGLCFRAARTLSSGGGGRSHRRDLTAGS